MMMLRISIVVYFPFFFPPREEKNYGSLFYVNFLSSKVLHAGTRLRDAAKDDLPAKYFKANTRGFVA